jgi:hypothetical protein
VDYLAAMKRVFLLLSSITALLLASCAGPTCWSGGIPLRPSEEAARQGAIADIGNTSNIKVYRGLAHPTAEKSLYDRQVDNGGWIEIHDFKFFKEPLDISKDTADQVLAIYNDPDSHQAWGPKTKCAGFHPDYVMVWSNAEGKKALQLCYGCHEWKFFGPGGMLLTDISEKAYFGKLTTKLLPKAKKKR